MLRLPAAVALATAAADQLAKALVEGLPLCEPPLRDCERITVGPLLLVHAMNRAGILGLGTGIGVWVIIAGLGLLLVPVYASQLAPGRAGYARRILAGLAPGLQVGGAGANLLDRLRQGAVTDYLAFSGFPIVFNLADAALVLGMVLGVVLLVTRRGQAR